MKYLLSKPSNKYYELLNLDYILVNHRYEKLVHFVEERNSPACDVLCNFNVICAFKSTLEYRQFLKIKNVDEYDKYYIEYVYRNLYIERLNVILNRPYIDVISSFLDTKIKKFNTKIKLEIKFKDGKKLLLTNGVKEHPCLSDSCYIDLHTALQNFINYDYLL
jgi:hypothetical protein